MGKVKEQIEALRKKKDAILYEIDELAESRMSTFSIEHTLGYWDLRENGN